MLKEKIWCKYSVLPPSHLNLFEKKMTKRFSEVNKNLFELFNLLTYILTKTKEGNTHNSYVTRAVLLIFLLELEISGVAVQRIHQNSKKW